MSGKDAYWKAEVYKQGKGLSGNKALREYVYKNN